MIDRRAASLDFVPRAASPSSLSDAAGISFKRAGAGLLWTS